jgi:hypothetical protein
MQLRPEALRFALAQGLPAVVEVSGGSMAPTLAKGVKVDVAALAAQEPVAPGEVVLFATSGDALLLHRVMATFVEDGAPFVVHQGDAPASTFAIAARADALARMTGFAGDGRALPTPDALDAAARARFHRRRLAVEGFLAARRLARALRLADGPLLRRGARLYRKITRSIVG